VFWCKNQIELTPTLRKIWRGTDMFAEIFKTQGKVYRQEKNRKTLRFCVDGKGYFLKLHQGVGWKEIFKNILQGRWPVLGADQEWHAIRRLKQIGVPTMELLGHGQRGWNPAQLQSFIVTAELTNTVSLEDFCGNWAQQPPSLKLKRALIAEVAKIAKLIHTNGLNHRDFYICHFLLQQASNAKLQLFLIDLHRMQRRTRTPQRWIIKDLAGLYFSSMDLGLTQRDLWWFVKHYNEQKDSSFWSKVTKKAQALYQKVHLRKS